MTKSTLKFIGFLFSFLSIAFLSTAQIGTSKWTYSNPKPFGFWSNQISYADDNNALVVGEAGAIAKTTDGGASWNYFAYTTTNSTGDLSRPTFNDVQCINSSLAYAVGSEGIMIKSIDGGINWSFVLTPFYTGKLEINTVCFLNATTGYIGGYGDPVTRRATIYKTTDGGDTWQPEFVFPEPLLSWNEPALYKIRFSASGVGYVGGAEGLVWKYENGVWSDYSITDSIIYPNVNATDTAYYDNWNGGFDTVAYSYSDNINGLSGQNYRGIAIINDTAVVVSAWNNGGLIRINTSTPAGNYLLLNNGNAYVPKYAPLNSPQMYNLICRDGNTVAGTSSEGKILISNDKGFTWSSNDVYPADAGEAGIGFFGIDISPSGRVGLCGQAGIVADSVTQWRRPYKFTKKSLGPWTGYSILSTSFADANYGMVAGSGGAMLRTADGGNNWEDISNPGLGPYDSYTSIANLSPNIVLAAVSNGQFYKSTDRGTSFDLLFTEPTNANLWAMDFVNEDTGWLVANVRYAGALIDSVNYIYASDTFHQFVYHTYDAGTTWDTSTTVFPYETDYSLNNYFTEIKFLNGKTGYAAGINGTLYKSVDGGLTWIKQSNLPAFAADKTINSIAVVDENVAYASGSGALVMKTVDGGNNWTMCPPGQTEQYASFAKILMYDAAQGLLFGRAEVYSTTDGGASWSPYYATVGGFNQFSAASFSPIAGCSGGICKKVFASAGPNIMKLDADVVLPVKFSNLTGTGTQEGNQLFWTAFSQETVTYFEIQHSGDGASFKKIGDKVYPGALGYESYQWLDAAAPAGKNFYRIKAVERSGAVFYTNIVMIATKKSSKWNYALSNGTLILNNVKVQKGDVTAMLINQAGQTVAAKSWKQNGGAFNQTIVLPPAAKGIYFVKIYNEGTEYSFKMLIQ
jgi:photosystem II stability/assembly factor-like uncharacterized protein